MAKRKVYPKSRQQDQTLIQRVQGDFSGGEVKDEDARSIPDNAVTSLVNIRGYETEARGRTGSVLYDATVLPYHDTWDGAPAVK